MFREQTHNKGGIPVHTFNKILGAFVAFGLTTATAEAAPSVGVSTSVGAGASLSDSGAGPLPTNIMVAPSLGLLGDVVRVEVGILAELDSAELGGPAVDLGLRPMLLIDPPLIPLHARLITSFQDNALSLGAAGGINLGLGPVQAFAEVGYIPGTIESVVEGRLGASLSF